MSTTRVVIVIATIVLLSALYSNTQQTPTAPIGNFQLVPAQYSITSQGSSWEQHSVFLIDSRSGQVWEFLPSRQDRDGKYHDSVLAPVKTLSP